MLARDGVAFDTVQAMVEGYDPSWPAIEGWITSVRDSVSIIASNATAILDLEAIVLGGLLPRDLAERLIPLVVMFDQKRRAQPRPTARLVPSEIEGNAAAIGAAMLPLRATYFR
jgi:predicted NBD/HSP70 family sugar kinase